MKIRTILLSAGLICSGAATAWAQGGITPDMMKELKASYEGNAVDKALHNAIAGTEITVLATNQENAGAIDTHFTYQVETVGVTDQHQSGRCWLFTGLNVLRSQAMRQHNIKDLHFSQCYNFFYDQLEKANLFLQGIIDTRLKPMDDKMVDWLFRHPLSDGGQFTGLSDNLSKYGVVPAEVMPETYSSNDTRTLARLMTEKLREQGLELRKMPKNAKPAEIELKKTEMLKVIYRMLALSLGEPVEKFTWTRVDGEGKIVSTKEYTPQSFYAEFLGNDLKGNYVMLMNDPLREYYKLYTIDFDRHVYDGENWLYINLPVEDIKKMGIESLKNGIKMYFSCDVGKCMDRKRGLLDVNNYDYESLMGTTFGMNKQERVATFASGSSHAMTMTAVDLDAEGKPTKWMVENSWGEKSGYKGHLIMTDEWFNEYMFRLVVEKRFVPAEILEILKQKPTVLPAWDPMFAEEE